MSNFASYLIYFFNKQIGKELTIFDCKTKIEELEYFYFANDNCPEILDRGGYFDGLPVDSATDLRRQTIFALQEMGICVQYSHHEVAPSQHEIDLRYDDALKMADKLMTHRTTVKEIARLLPVECLSYHRPSFARSQNGYHFTG